jgi:hypothetical protein
LRKQEEIKEEEIEIVYSYWDGSGHRSSVTVLPSPAPLISFRFLTPPAVQERRRNRNIPR